MRWILCGKNDVAIAALELLVERGDEVWVVGVAGDDGEPTWQGSLVAAARRLGVALDQPANVNAPDFVERLRAYGARALISIQYDQILRAPLFGRISCPCLNLHYSLLPRHRGVYPIAWAILEGDAVAGVTLHHMAERIDAGDLIAQREVPVGPAETARELYDRISALAARLFRECVPFSDELLATRLAQDPARACYHSYADLDYGRRRVDWKRPAAELQRWIRMMIFPPLNHPETALRGTEVALLGVSPELGPAAAADPGQVVAVSGGGALVAGGDGRTLRITGLAPAARPERPDAALLRTVSAGDRFA